MGPLREDSGKIMNPGRGALEEEGVEEEEVEEEEVMEWLIQSEQESCLKMEMIVAQSVYSSFRFILWESVTTLSVMFVLRGCEFCVSETNVPFAGRIYQRLCSRTCSPSSRP